MSKFLLISNPGEWSLWRKEFTGIYIMKLVSLVTFENFKWLFLAPAVIYNNCNFTKQEYWSNILSNELLGGNVWTPLAILSHVQCQWKVCYNKLKQENFLKTDVGGKIQDICQELVVTSFYTSFFLKYLEDS